MATNSTALFVGVIVACLVLFFFFFLRKPKVVVVQRMDPMACCPPCGRGIRFFDYMEDMLSGDARLYHEFMQLKGMWDCDSPQEKPFISDETRKNLRSLIIPNRIRVRLVDSGECFCMRMGLKDRRTYLETPDGERRYKVLFREKQSAECLEDVLWLDRNIIQSILSSPSSQEFSLVDEHGRNVGAKLDINVDDFIKLRDALDQLQYLLQDFVKGTYKQ
jgi:hypothetical protein